MNTTVERDSGLIPLWTPYLKKEKEKEKTLTNVTESPGQGEGPRSFVSIDLVVDKHTSAHAPDSAGDTVKKHLWPPLNSCENRTSGSQRPKFECTP